MLLNTECCCSYRQDLEFYCLIRSYGSQELSCVPPNYMDNQQDLNERMRGILIDWLIEVDRSKPKSILSLLLFFNVADDKFT